MDKERLIEKINFYLSEPQKSERWAMYRLITPIVDFANQSMNLKVEFEYNQTSRHNTSQSVDIALTSNKEPIIMIEAKRINRKISADEITKYLNNKSRGIVTNGENWILCSGGKNNSINISNENELVIENNLNEVISFIRGEKISSNSWSKEITYYKPKIKPPIKNKPVKAQRKVNQITRIKTIIEIDSFIKNSPKLSDLDITLLKTIFKEVEIKGGINENFICECRTTRASFFSKSNNSSKGKRIARIEFNKKQPDVLILKELLELNGSQSMIIDSEPHSKGGHMRRFRLSDIEQTKDFGQKMTKILMNSLAYS